MSAKSKEDLVSQGFTEFTIEDFHNTVSRGPSPVGHRGGGELGPCPPLPVPPLTVAFASLGPQFMDLIEQVEKQTSVAELLTSFNDQSTSDYLVVYLRLLTSGYLQRESKFFEHFIEGGRTVKEFCQQVPPSSTSLALGAAGVGGRWGVAGGGEGGTGCPGP